MQVLIVDKNGYPLRWAHPELACTYHAKKQVLWEVGETLINFRGGLNKQGVLSSIRTAPIIAIDGDNAISIKRLQRPPRLTNKDLFARDKYTCQYCHNVFPICFLTRDHVHPRARGGLDTWENCVTACEKCNHKKGPMLLSELNIILKRSPYAPTKAECLLLRSKNMLNSQADYLAQFIHGKNKH